MIAVNKNSIGWTLTMASMFLSCHGAFAFAPARVPCRNTFSSVSSRATTLPIASRTCYRPGVTALFLNINSNDPFEILGLNVSPDLDKKEIKRAYKRMAVKYHPDVVTNQSSTAEEKRKANDVFAKINWAYATLSGKNQDQQTSTTKSATTTNTGYTPPHRRTTKTSYDTNVSTDWRDYMPKYDEAEYDTGGDSLGSIFSDLFSGVAGVAASGGGPSLFRDFIEFLEGNDMAGGKDGDTNLAFLLQTGSLQDIANEMDDTDLVVQQLSAKLSNVENELIMRQADLKATTRYIEKLDLGEKVDELEARKKVVQGYLKKARARLLKLQTRYKELIVGGEDDSRARGRSSSARDSAKSNSSSSYDRSTSSSSSSPRDTQAPPSDSTDEDAWKTQGFRSAGSRGSGRRRRDPTTDSSSSTSQENTTTRTPPPPRQESTTTSATPLTNQRTTTGSSSWEPPVPPHRRTAPPSQAQDDKRRLRELKVDDEFEKLKKELGL